MKALAAAAILGMAAVGMSSCPQPTDPTIIEEPTEKEPEETTPVDEETPIIDDEETNPIDDEETKPVVDDDDTKPTSGVDETPFIVNDTISPALADTAAYKLLREVGFSHITGEEVPVEAGKYQPKTGEITELNYTRKGMDPITCTLNRDLSTDGHLVYDTTQYYPYYGDSESWTGDEFSLDTENKIFTHYNPDEDGDHNCYEYRYIKVKEDGSIVQGKYKMDPESEDPAKRVPHDFADEVPSWFDSTKSCNWDSSIKYEDTIWSGEKDEWTPNGVTDFSNITFKLAK